MRADSNRERLAKRMAPLPKSGHTRQPLIIELERGGCGVLAAGRVRVAPSVAMQLGATRGALPLGQRGQTASNPAAVGVGLTQAGANGGGGFGVEGEAIELFHGVVSAGEGLRCHARARVDTRVELFARDRVLGDAIGRKGHASTKLAEGEAHGDVASVEGHSQRTLGGRGDLAVLSPVPTPWCASARANQDRGKRTYCMVKGLHGHLSGGEPRRRGAMPDNVPPSRHGVARRDRIFLRTHAGHILGSVRGLSR